MGRKIRDYPKHLCKIGKALNEEIETVRADFSDDYICSLLDNIEMYMNITAKLLSQYSQNEEIEKALKLQSYDFILRYDLHPMFQEFIRENNITNYICTDKPLK